MHFTTSHKIVYIKGDKIPKPLLVNSGWKQDIVVYPEANE